MKFAFALIALVAVAATAQEVNINFHSMFEGLDFGNGMTISPTPTGGPYADEDHDHDDDSGLWGYKFDMGNGGYARLFTYVPSTNKLYFFGEKHHVMAYSHYTEPVNHGYGFGERPMGGSFWWCGMNTIWSKTTGYNTDAPRTQMPTFENSPGANVMLLNTNPAAPAWNVASFGTDESWIVYEMMSFNSRVMLAPPGVSVSNINQFDTTDGANNALFHTLTGSGLANMKFYLLWQQQRGSIIMIVMHDPIQAVLDGISAPFNASNYGMDSYNNKCWGQKSGDWLQGWGGCDLSSGVLVDVSFELTGTVNPTQPARIEHIYGPPTYPLGADHADAYWGGFFGFPTPSA